MGNLTSDIQGEIETIEWTLNGKIKKIIRTSTSTKADLYFDYGPMSNRVMKKVVENERNSINAFRCHGHTGSKKSHKNDRK